MPVIVPVKAWADHRSGATVYYIDGQPISGIGAVPLANLSNWSRGALIIGGVATWGATAHPGGAGYALTTDANDTLWDQTPAWSGRHTFSAGIELPDAQSIGITGNELLTVNAAGTFAFSGIVGVTVEDGDYIGIASDVRAVFDSSNGFIELTLGDAAGSDEVQVIDSGAGVVARIDSDGNGYFLGDVGIGQTPTVKLDIGQTLGEFAIVFGADIAGSDTRTNATRKVARIGAPHYTNAEESIVFAEVDSDSAYSAINIGGGTAIGNAATLVRFYTAANTTTTTGTERGRFNTSGYFLVGATTGSAQVYIDQASATGAVPVLYLDQGDVSEQHIVLSMNGVDQDFPNILQLNVTGSPALWWDESESAFGFKNVAGILVEDGDWIGTDSAVAWLFDTSNNDISTTVPIGVGTASPDRLIHAETSDAATNTIVYPLRLSHTTSGTSTTLFGVGSEHELEDDAGNMQVASEAVTLWASAASGSETPLRRWTTYPQGSAGPGYMGFWSYNDLNNSLRNVIPNGTGDVTTFLWVRFVVISSGGAMDTATIEGIAPGNSSVLLTDTDDCTITVNVDGSVTIVSSGTTDTFDVALLMVWI